MDFMFKNIVYGIMDIKSLEQTSVKISLYYFRSPLYLSGKYKAYLFRYLETKLYNRKQIKNPLTKIYEFNS